MLWLNGWLWIIAALILAGLELAVPGWVFLGMAIAVAMMGLLLLADIWTATLPLTLVVTAILSGIVWLVLRRIVGIRKGQVRIWDRDIND